MSFYASTGDLRDLLKAKDYQIKQDSLAREALGHAPDPDWDREFAIRVGAYEVASGDARRAISLTPEWLMINPNNDRYNAVMRSLRFNWKGIDEPQGALMPGDLADLEARLMRAGGKPDYSQMPQPDPANDWSLRIFKLADKATRAIEKGAEFSLGLGALVLAVVLLANARGR